ncbi:MAG: type II toxin-antitoxin system RelE/ParE family toxin [Candidatus Woesearchaeota archaeon]
MSYEAMVNQKCQEEIKKACRKNSLLETALKKKINEILENPQHYKPLRYDFAEERRVHVLKSFVLIFEIDETKKTVNFIAFLHHDDAYRR